MTLHLTSPPHRLTHPEGAEEEGEEGSQPVAPLLTPPLPLPSSRPPVLGVTSSEDALKQRRRESDQLQNHHSSLHRPHPPPHLQRLPVSRPASSIMLRPLLYLYVLIGVAESSVVAMTSYHIGNSEVKIPSTPIKYYGQKYEQFYVNYSSENTTFCFDGPQTRQDCIVMPPAASQFLKVVSGTPKKTIENLFPHIKASSPHAVQLWYNTQSGRVTLVLADFETETGVIVGLRSPTEVDFLVNGITVDTLNITSSLVTLDISRCRLSGVIYKRGEGIPFPDSCSFCNDIAVISTRGCGVLESCQSNSICMLDTSCTVTGPAVIDSLNNVRSIQDRCAYSLLSTPSVPDFHVLASFRERRRKDVSFLDSVTLRLDVPGVHIHLKQGGRVQLDDRLLDLNSSAQQVHGVELSKDPTGVTAKMSHSNYTISVFFDGNTAQIRLKGDAAGVNVSLQGLCGNSNSSLSDVRLSNYSTRGCEVQHSDAADSSINCSLATQRCDLLKEAPFTVCHSLIDPEPYIAACADTLCRYPAVDGLNCQFLEVYSGACSLHSWLDSRDTLESWRSQAGCLPPQAFCRDKICGDQEFCGEKPHNGEICCFCRAIFSSPYTSMGTLGDPAVCDQNSASVSLLGCLLEERGIDYSTLRLKDQTCTGRKDELTGKVTFRFDRSSTCGTVVTANNSQIIYKNTIMTQNSSDVIIRQEPVYIDFSCSYTLPEIKSAAFMIQDSSVIHHIESGSWNYTLSMRAYTDAGHTRAVQLSTEVQLDQKIWVVLKTDGLDGRLVAVVTDSCWATSKASASANPRYDLLKNGCANPNDKTLKVEGNGLGTSNYFSFNMFRFSGTSGDVYLHCKVKLCPKLSQDCSPTCGRGARTRRSSRSKYEDEATAFITMAWTT